MRLEKYELKIDPTESVFSFISEGSKGQILKSIYYSKIKVKGFKNVYNLAFGDKISESDDFDDLIITNNQDREKVLATDIFIYCKPFPS